MGDRAEAAALSIPALEKAFPGLRATPYAVTSPLTPLDYAPCADDQRENGFEKVAIFVDSSGTPTHAARQMGSGMWSSKLGKEHDIAHELLGVCGRHYGSVGMIVKRPATKA